MVGFLSNIDEKMSYVFLIYVACAPNPNAPDRFVFVEHRDVTLQNVEKVLRLALSLSRARPAPTFTCSANFSTGARVCHECREESSEIVSRVPRLNSLESINDFPFDSLFA